MLLIWLNVPFIKFNPVPAEYIVWELGAAGSFALISTPSIFAKVTSVFQANVEVPIVTLAVLLLI